MTTTDRTLPGKLARARSALGFTQDEVALAAGWSRQHQRQLEREDDPTDVEADRLEAILGVDIGAVLEGAAAPAAGQPLGHLLKGQATALDAGSRLALGESVQVARPPGASGSAEGAHRPASSSWSIISSGTGSGR